MVLNMNAWHFLILATILSLHVEFQFKSLHDKITFSNYFVFPSKTTLSTSGLEVQGATKTGTICHWFWHKCTVVKRGSLSQINQKKKS